MATARNPPSCFEKATSLLSVRPHFRAELGRKLRTRGYAEVEVEEALERLERIGYLDDLQAARGFVRSRRRRGLGRRRMAAELMQRGVAEGVVEQSLELELSGSEIERARETAARWGARRSFDAAALARHLDRKGYSQRVILQLLEECAAAGIPPTGPAGPRPSDERHPVDIATPCTGPRPSRDRTGSSSDASSE